MENRVYDNVRLRAPHNVNGIRLVKKIMKSIKAQKKIRRGSALCDINGPGVDVWRLTRRAERGFYEGFRSGGYRLHRPGLFGC